MPTRLMRLLAVLTLAIGLAGPAMAQSSADQLNKLSLESLTAGGGSASPGTYARPRAHRSYGRSRYYGRPRAYRGHAYRGHAYRGHAYHGRPHHYGLYRGARPHYGHAYHRHYARPHHYRR